MTHERFLEDYYYANRPLVLAGRVRDSRAVRTWSPEFFREHYGDVPIRMTAGRDADPDYECCFDRSVCSVTLGELVDRLSREPRSNDFYLVARNHFFDNPALRHLRRDLEPPQEIIDRSDQRAGTAKLWFGPQGTVTPLHVDEHSILFLQLYGRKLVKLIGPFDHSKLYVRERFYSAVDPERVDPRLYPAFLQASVAEVLVEPGDVLFIPVGWWHWVKSLDVSISSSMCSFRVPGGNTVLEWS